MRRRVTSRRRLVLLGVAILVVVAGGVAIVLSRNMRGGGTCTTSIPVEKDVKDALAYGAAFEPEQWKPDWANHPDSVSARWFDGTGLAHVDFLRYNCGLTRADLDQYACQISLGGYDRWQRTAQCEKNGVILHEFNVIYTGQDYRTRFWLQPMSDTRLVALQLTFPATRLSDLDKYAARLFPELSACK